MDINQYTKEAVELLQRLIATPSVSREENAAADILADFIEKCGLPVKRIGNNILVQEALDDNKPTLLLNAHIDTVKPVSSWTRDPFQPVQEGDLIYGLGSNDCGGGLVATLQTYRIMLHRPRNYNILWVASAEEEVDESFAEPYHQQPERHASDACQDAHQRIQPNAPRVLPQPYNVLHL